MARSNSPDGGQRRRRFHPALLVLLLLIVLGVAGVFLVQRGSGPAVAETNDGQAADTDSTEMVADASQTEDADGEKKDDENDEDGDEEDEAVAVEVATVLREDVPAYFTGTAALEADKEATLLAEVSGRITALHVEEGDRVTRGQVLLEIDDRSQRATLEERIADLANLEAEVRQKESLFEKGLGSESDVITARSSYESALARKRAAELNVSLTEVVAPFDAVVTRRLLDVGDHAPSGSEILTLADATPLLARIYMPERQVTRIAVGQPVEVRSDAEPGVVHTGRVSLIAPVVDRRTGTVKVTVELDPREGRRVRPGSFVKARVEVDRHPDTLTIPEKAVLEQGGEVFVFAVDGEENVRKVRVETGYVHDDRIEVLSGLHENDRVVTAGKSSLKADSTIRIIEDTAIANADPGAES